MRIRVQAKLATAVAAMFVAMSIVGAAGAQAATPPPTPPNAPVGAATTYQINSVHDGLATDAMSSPLYKTWSRNLGATVGYPLVVGGRVFVVTENPSGNYGTELWALNAEDGSTEWGPLSVNGTYFIAGIAADGANVYIVNFDGLLTAINQVTGARVWSAQMPVQWSFTSPPTVHNGVVYLGGTGNGGTLFAVSAATGGILWTAGVSGDGGSPAVTDDGVYVVYGCGFGSRFNPSTGQKDWSPTNYCDDGGGKTAVVHDGKVYVRDGQYSHVLDATTGAVVGSFTSTTAPAFAGDVGYYLQGSTLRAVDTATNQVLWSQAGDGGLDSAPIVLGSEVAIGSSTGRIYVLNAQTGVVDWSADTGSPITAPDEQNARLLTGLAASGGQLFVPASNVLVAYAHLDPNAPFVMALYQDFLGRSADSTGLTYWDGMLHSGTSRDTVAATIAYSLEAARYHVAGLYTAILGRPADSAGLQYWTVGFGERPDGIAESLYASSEYFAKAGGSDAAWVQALYRDTLGRPASSSEVAFWTGVLQNSGRRSVATRIYSSPEAANLRINYLYQQLLGRAADAGGLVFFRTVVAQLGTSAVAVDLAASPEYFAHAFAGID